MDYCFCSWTSCLQRHNRSAALASETERTETSKDISNSHFVQQFVKWGSINNHSTYYYRNSFSRHSADTSLYNLVELLEKVY
jgi:hypothetical protein